MSADPSPGDFKINDSSITKRISNSDNSSKNNNHHHNQQPTTNNK